MLAEIWRLRNFTFLDGKMIEDKGLLRVESFKNRNLRKEIKK